MRLKYTGAGPVHLPAGYGLIVPGQTTPPLPDDIGRGLAKRPDFTVQNGGSDETDLDKWPLVMEPAEYLNRYPNGKWAELATRLTKEE